MTRFRIFPPIGIARLGQAENFFIGPEIPSQGPGELQADGKLGPITQFKDATRTKIRKQGARFHLFESEDGTNWKQANLPAGATVTWTVRLVNKKSAVIRQSLPPTKPTRPQVPTNNASLVIDGGERTISGPDNASSDFKGTFTTTAPSGQPFVEDVILGRLRTDKQGRLIVLGGSGISKAPPGVPIGPSFYQNPKWYDDVSDGPVKAEIRMTPTSLPVEAEGGAWVIVAPPDYAPEIDCPVTLYDVIRQLGIKELGLPAPGVPSFDLDIAPVIARVRRLQWVHDLTAWSDARLTSPKLRSKDDADKQLRQGAANIVRSVQNIFKGYVDNPPGPPYELRAFQKQFLTDWEAGNFDATPATFPDTVTAEGLTQAALEGAAGQGFCPGIEAGIIVEDKTLYRMPFDFRFDHNSVEAGDITALMAQPWQADFVECKTEWWPTQRPDIAPQNGGQKPLWSRGASTKKLMVERSGRLGVVVRQGTNEVFLEVERDPQLP